MIKLYKDRLEELKVSDVKLSHEIANSFAVLLLLFGILGEKKNGLFIFQRIFH